jgi:SAM-dependent methyltransferase
MKFVHPGDSHRHSLQVLNALYEYDDFMESIATVVDLGCGTGEDLEWWATRTTREDNPQPLNIRCLGIDLLDQLPMTKQYANIAYQSADFEEKIHASGNGFDILWCHDAFQYCVNPVQTLSRWWQITSSGGMLYIAVPQTIDFYRRQFDYHLPSGCYYHYTMVSLMYMLATAGWDCRSGFFKQFPTDNWIHAVVYKSTHEPLDPKTATWHKLVELNLLPESANHSIHAHNYLRQQDLIVPWIDHSLMSMAIK